MRVQQPNLIIGAVLVALILLGVAIAWRFRGERSRPASTPAASTHTNEAFLRRDPESPDDLPARNPATP